MESMAGASLTPQTASRFAQLALRNIAQEYPSKLDHVLANEREVLAPRRLHPAFHGSFDWHSCVHAHWMLVRLLKCYPGLPEEEAVRRLLRERLAPANLDGECVYLGRPEARAFERTYGWAWLLKLAEEIACWDDEEAHQWSSQLAPLAQIFVRRYLDYLPYAAYPIRHGVHQNSAFGLAFALDYAMACDSMTLAAACSDKAREWYLGDVDGTAPREPSGADFLSPTLVQADLMRRVLTTDEFPLWLGRFLPAIERKEPRALFAPVSVSDRSDPYIVHLDGLNLSRAWCWDAIAHALPDGDPRSPACIRAAQQHLDAGLEGLANDDYAGGHWLATFAVLALTS
jgi:DUF2891 family protein